MNLRGFLMACATLGVMSAADPGLTQIRQVYVLPMSGGLDQYLANKLTRNGRYVVVTDPDQADALLTDQVGTAFEERMHELYPPPEPPPAPKSEAKKQDKAEEKQDKPEEKSVASLMGEAGAGARGRTSVFSRGKGNVFLVERSSKRVIWSTFLRPRTSRPEELNRTADKIVDRLDGDAGHQEKQMQRDQRKSSEVAPVMGGSSARPAPAPAAPKAPAEAPRPAAAPASAVTATPTPAAATPPVKPPATPAPAAPPAPVK